MAVIRIEKTKNYTVMSNYHLRDKDLSLKAKGLLSIMLSLPEGWHYNVRGLASICKEGISSISAALKELEAGGYMKRYQPIVDGKFQEIEYIIYESPQNQQFSAENSSEPDDLFQDAVPVGTASPFSDDTFPENESYSDDPYTENPCTENLNTVNPNTANPHTASPYTATTDTQKSNTQNRHAYKVKSTANTQRKNTGVKNNPSINPQTDSRRMDRSMGQPAAGEVRPFANNASAGPTREQYKNMIRDNIAYEDLCMAHPYETKLIDGMVNIMLDAVCSTAPTLRIDQQDIPQKVVKSRFLKLNYSNIEYVLHCFSEHDQKITRIDRYLLTMLYKAPDTQDAFYKNWVQSTMYV